MKAKLFFIAALLLGTAAGNVSQAQQKVRTLPPPRLDTRYVSPQMKSAAQDRQQKGNKSTLSARPATTAPRTLALPASLTPEQRERYSQAAARSRNSTAADRTGQKKATLPDYQKKWKESKSKYESKHAHQRR